MNKFNNMLNLKENFSCYNYSIKRLFYLATAVKIQFFKTFILPYFDYCLSLIIYFPKSTFQSLNYFFNCCLYRLFKFKPEIPSNEYDDENKLMNDFINKLENYNLFTLQSRITSKLLNFAYKLKVNFNAPIELQQTLESIVSLTDLELKQSSHGVYSLKSGNIEKIEITKGLNFSAHSKNFTTHFTFQHMF